LRSAAILLLIATPPAVAAEFLWLSDIHFDPLADSALVDNLAAAEPAEWAVILAGGSTKFPVYGRDTSWPLLASVLQASTKTQPNTAFTLVTGDLLVHHFREQFNAAATVHDDEAFRNFVRKTVEFVGLQLKQRSPGTPVFITLGNNDDECGDYAVQPDGPFLHDTAKVVGNLAGLANTDSYVHYGSYSLANPAVEHQRIIVLNTVFFSPRYTDRCGQGAGDAGEKLLAWLASELESAKSQHEKVWLVYHIPPGVDAFATAHAKAPGTLTLLWKESYTNKFLSLLEQYSAAVGPSFAGHVHVDDFRLLGGSLKTSPFVIIGPAVSPITGQNPTFRTVSFDAHGKLKDEATYYLKNLTEAGKDTLPVWQLEYDFEKEWRLKGLNAQTYSSLFERIENSTETSARWSILYSTSHPASSNAPDSFRLLYCAAGGVTAQAYQSCVARKETKHGKTAD
jgi:hypothetical protein